MVTSKKLWMTIALGLLWLGGAWVALQDIRPTPSELYEDWLQARRAPAPPGVIERWSSRMGIRFVAEMRRRADFRLTETLLVHEDYALAVASWRDTSPGFAPGVLETWPHVRRALSQQFGKGEWQSLQDAFSRADAAGFSDAGLALARSAERSRAMQELDVIIEELREFERELGRETALSDSLGEISRIYSLSIAELGRALAMANDAAAESKVRSVMQARGVSPQQAYLSLWREWKTTGLPEEDLDLASRWTRDPRWGTSRTEYLTWLMLKPGSEVWRKSRRGEIGGILEDARTSDPAFARDLASLLVREMMKESAELGEDWNFTAGWLLAKIDPEPDLSQWIHDSAGPDFAWLCRQVNAEALLNRAVAKWAGQIRNPHGWIGEFIDSGHFAAACALIEGSGEDIVSIRSRAETYQEETSKGLGDYLELAGEIARHTSHSQVKGYIQLMVGKRALANLRRTSEDGGARGMVLEAIAQLNEAETVHPGMLRQTVGQLVEMDPEFFEAGRPCFDRWRGGQTPDGVLDRVIHGEWQADARGYEIWKKYFKNFLTISEIPSLEATAVELILAAPRDKGAIEKLDRINDFLGTESGHSETPGLGVTIWFAKRLAVESQWVRSADWIFGRMSDFRAIDPDTDQTTLIRHIYRAVTSELADRPVTDCLRWLGAVLSHQGSEIFSWPESFTSIIYRRRAADPVAVLGEIGELLENHPLRCWIARVLLENGRYVSKFSAYHPETLLTLTNRPWLKAVIVESFGREVDLDAFEIDFENASPGAKRFFYEHPLIRRDAKVDLVHPTGRDLTKEELSRFLLWEARQAIEIAERREYFESYKFVQLFTDLMSEAETRPDDPVFGAIFERLQGISFEASLHRFGDYELKSLRELQARALPYAKGTSETDNLLTNKGLPVTERVWKLALKGEFAAARKLMEENPNELDYEIPKGMKREELNSATLAKFLKEFSGSDELGIYVSVYLSELRDLVPPYGAVPNGTTSLPLSKSAFTKREESLLELILPFESAIFVNAKLELRTTAMIGKVIGAPGLIPRKLAAMREAKLNGGYSEILRFLEFDARLMEGDCGDIKRHLADLFESGRGVYSGRPLYAVEVLEYHLWRRAILGMEITDEQRDVIEELCFSPTPLHGIGLSRTGSSLRYAQFRRGSKIYSLALGLEMIDKLPRKEADWTWRDFDGLHLNRYRFATLSYSGLLFNAAAVLAARCGELDEDSRWRLMSVFESKLPGESTQPHAQTFSMFAAADFISQDETTRRVRDFVMRYPGRGWNCLAAAGLGSQFKDAALVEFALKKAENYIDHDPELEKAVKRMRERLPKP